LPVIIFVTRVAYVMTQSVLNTQMPSELQATIIGCCYTPRALSEVILFVTSHKNMLSV